MIVKISPESALLILNNNYDIIQQSDVYHNSIVYHNIILPLKLCLALNRKTLTKAHFVVKSIFG